MKTFQWSEVLDFLGANLDRTFFYDKASFFHPCGCLMSEFFKSKGFGVPNSVSFNGLEVQGSERVIAKIENAPLKRIGDVHRKVVNGRIIDNLTGREILDNINGLVAQG